MSSTRLPTRLLEIHRNREKYDFRVISGNRSCYYRATSVRGKIAVLKERNLEPISRALIKKNDWIRAMVSRVLDHDNFLSFPKSPGFSGGKLGISPEFQI